MLHSVALAGSNRGAVRAALIGIAKLNEIAPQVWRADVPARTADTPQSRLKGTAGPWSSPEAYPFKQQQRSSQRLIFRRIGFGRLDDKIRPQLSNHETKAATIEPTWMLGVLSIWLALVTSKSRSRAPRTGKLPEDTNCVV